MFRSKLNKFLYRYLNPPFLGLKLRWWRMKRLTSSEFFVRLWCGSFSLRPSAAGWPSLLPRFAAEVLVVPASWELCCEVRGSVFKDLRSAGRFLAARRFFIEAVSIWREIRERKYTLTIIRSDRSWLKMALFILYQTIQIFVTWKKLQNYFNCQEKAQLFILLKSLLL